MQKLNPVAAAKQAALSHLRRLDPKIWTYHNWQHTAWVAETLGCLAPLFLSQRTSQALEIAAWWHDVGYVEGGAKDHENRSIAHLKTWLETASPSLWLFDYWDLMQNAIAATRLGAKPACEASAFLADVDLAYGLSWAYAQRSAALRTEWANTGQIYTEDAWQNLQKDFLQSLEYKSPWGRACFSRVLRQNSLSLAE